MSLANQQKILAITMGCPVGIGPEIILKSCVDIAATNSALPVVVGDLSVLENCAAVLGIDVQFACWHPGISQKDDTIYVCQVPESVGGIDLSRTKLAWGCPDRLTGKAMASYITYAVQGIQRGDFSGLVTCPITKKALNEAGYGYPGHTEMLADLCKCTDYAMMMAGTTLRVTLVTIHQALNQVAAQLSVESVYRLIDLTARSLQVDFGLKNPQVGVAGLNPHAGEDGLFGQEEMTIIQPAVDRAAEKWDVHGPFPPDTVFNKAVTGEFDAVVCMYHDQGLIPFKLLHFADGVNVTLGLPIVRTSVDHGTAYDIAGKGLANPDSLFAAYKMAGEIVGNRLSE